MATTVTTLPLAAIVPSAANPRKKFDEAALGELAESLKTIGLLEPLVVRSQSEDGISPVRPAEIIAGERRYRAAQLAGLTEVPVRVLALTDAQASEAMLVENLQRVDLTPMEEARAFHAWIEARGKAETAKGRHNYPRDLAERIGKSEDYVRERLKLQQLDEACMAAIEDGKIGVTEALLLLEFPEDMRGGRLKEVVEAETTAGDLRLSLQWLREDAERQRARAEAAKAAPEEDADAEGEGADSADAAWEHQARERREKQKARVDRHEAATKAYLAWLSKTSGAERTRELALAMVRDYEVCKRAAALLGRRGTGAEAKEELGRLAAKASGAEMEKLMLALLAVVVCGAPPHEWDSGDGLAVKACKRLKIQVADAKPKKAKKGGKREGKKG